MALAATTIFEVQTGGSDTANGGGFNPGNGNFPTDGAVSSATTAAPVFSSASYSFVAGDVGAWIFIKSGTNSIPGWYKIASVAAGAATLSAASGAGVLYVNGTAGQPTAATGCGTAASLTTLTWGLDYSQGATTLLTLGGTATSVGAGSTFTNSNVGKNWVGNLVQITGGTNFTVGVFEVISTTGTTATTDRACTTGAGAAGAGTLGGPFASPGMAGSVKVAGADIFVAAGTYTLTSTTANVAGGKVSDTTGGASQTNPTLWTGYGTVRNDRATGPVLSAGTLTTFSVLATSGNYTLFDNLTVDANAKASVVAFDFSLSARSSAARCLAQNTAATGKGFTAANDGAAFYWCRATGCAGAPFDVGTNTLLVGCESYGNTTSGFSGAGTAVALIGCIASGNSGATSDGFALTGRTLSLVGCTASGNGRHGFNCQPTAFTVYLNCVATGNAGYGFTNTAATSGLTELRNCAGFNNTSGHVNGTPLPLSLGFVTLTGDPFVNAASGNFALNSTAGAGAALRGTGYGTYPRGTSVGYPDIGAVQHQDAGGASLAIPPLTGVLAA